MSTANEPTILLSARTLATLLEVSTSTVWRMHSAGKLPAPVRVGHGVRWLRAEILAWTEVGCPDRREWTVRRGDVLRAAGR